MRKVDNLASVILNKFDSWSADRSQKTGDWDRQSRLLALRETASDRTKKHEGSMLKIPKTKSSVTLAVDNLFRILFTSGESFKIEGQSIEDNLKAKKLTKYIQFLWKQEGFKHKFKSLIYELSAFGTGICKVNATKKFDQKIVSNRNGKAKVVKRDIVRPEFEWISIKDFFIEPQATDIQSSSGVIMRRITKLHVLREMEANGVLSGTDLISQATSMALDSDKQVQLQRAGINAELKEDDVTIFEYWGWMDEDILNMAGFDGKIENGGAEIVAIIANGVIVLDLMENPFLIKEKPFFKGHWEELPGEFYGLGICDISQGAQMGLDATVRSRIDNKKIAINQVFAIDETKVNVDPDGEIFSGKTFYTQGRPSDAIMALPIPDVTRDSYREAQEFERLIEEGTGVSSILGGQVSNKTQSATEASIAQTQSNVRIQTVGEEIEANIIVKILEWYYRIIAQFMEKEETFKVIGSDLFENQSDTITRAEVIGDYDFIPTGVLDVVKKQEFIKIMDFLTRTANQFDIQITNREVLLKKAYEALGFNDAESVFSKKASGSELLEKSKGASGVGGVAGVNSKDIGQLLQ